MHGRLRTSCPVIAVALALTVCSGAVAGHAEENLARKTEASALADDFYLGLSHEEYAPVGEKLEILRFGNSVVFRSRAGKNDIAIECALCTPGEMRTAARSLGAVIAAGQGQKTPARLSVQNLGESGSVVVDGVPFAPASSAHPIEPGDHDVVLEQDGRAEEASVRVLPETDVVFDAEAFLIAKRMERRLKVLLGGLGVTAAALGGVFLGLDGNCASATVDPAGNCRDQHRLAPAGWSLVATGILIEAALLIWVLLPDRKGERDPGAAP